MVYRLTGLNEAKTWIVAAQHDGARIYRFQKTKVEGAPHRFRYLHLLEEWAWPQGRVKNQEIESDRPGRSFDSVGHHRHALEKERDPHTTLLSGYAKQLAIRLKKAHQEKKVDHVIVMAEPQFLGMIIEKASRHFPKSNMETISKDYSKRNESEIEELILKNYPSYRS